MTQIETNACIAVDTDVLYVARSGITYKARVVRLYEHERCDLRVFNMAGTTTVYQASYDSDGQVRHSWRKASDATASSEIHKQRCPIDSSTLFYFTGQGLSQRCRHCKGVHIIPWAQILQEYAELCGEAVPQG